MSILYKTNINCNRLYASQHISTWYKLADVDNYLEKFYEDWANKNKKTSLNIDNYFDFAK